MPIIVDCPECGGRFKTRDELAGRRVKCPKCGEAVKVVDGDERSVAAGPPRRRSRPVDDDDADDRPRRRGRSCDDDEEDDDYDRPRKKKSGKGLIIGLCVGGGLLVVGGIVLVIILISGKGGSSNDLLIGEWEAVEGPAKGQRIEFTKDGKLIAKGFGGRGPVDYRLKGDSELEVTVPPEEREMLKALRKKHGKSGPDDAMTMKITITKDEFVLYPTDLVPDALQQPSKYKRVGGAVGDGDTAPDRRLENDLRQIGFAYHNHFDARRKAPARAEDLVQFMENDKRLLNLLKNDLVFIYNVGPLDMPDGSTNTVLAYQRDVPTGGGYVLYGDGHVERITAAEFRTKPKAGQKK